MAVEPADDTGPTLAGAGEFYRNAVACHKAAEDKRDRAREAAYGAELAVQSAWQLVMTAHDSLLAAAVADGEAS